MPTKFNLAAHHVFLQEHGETLSYYRGLPCPCGQTVDAARVRYVCPLCKGTGIRYETAVPLVAIITGISREKSLLEVGIAQPGDAVMGLSPFETQMVTDWDMVEPTSWGRGQPYSGELVERQAGATDVLVYKAKEILNCHSVHPTTFVITNYAVGTNFSVADDQVTWIVGQPQPAVGTIYSIKYAAVFAYIAFVIPQDRYDNMDSLGGRCLLRPRHIAIQKRTTP